MGDTRYKKALERDNADDYRIVRELLEQVGMSGFAHRSFFTLSGGEQQRVIMARALAQQTPCLILDEPTNHLDIKYQLQLMDIIKSSDKTVISAIHDLNIAAMYCDRIYAYDGSGSPAGGTPDEVLTEELIGDVYEVPARYSQEEQRWYPAYSLLPIVMQGGIINMKIGVLNCLKANECCTSAACLNALNSRKPESSGIPAKKFPSSPLPAATAAARVLTPALQKSWTGLFRKAPKRSHLGICTNMEAGNARPLKAADYLKKRGIEIIRGTH